MKMNLKRRGEASRLDSALVGFISSHANLFLACTALGLAAWEVSRHSFWPVAAMTLIGALGYYFGLTISLFAASPFLVWGAVSLLTASGSSFAELILQALGYSSIGWLGFRHKTIAHRQRASASHDPQILPWNTVNEVRTSLAAIRFLLFPLQNPSSNQELTDVTKELARLEGLFNEMEQRQAQEWSQLRRRG